MSNIGNSSEDRKGLERDQIKKAHKWFLSDEGKEAIDSAIAKSDRFKQKLEDLQCSDPKNLDVVVNL